MRVPIGAGRDATVILAKNPAGWSEALRHVAEREGAAVTLAVNARVADGKDPSWLWDVPYEWLQGHPVAAAGERHLDLAVRLRYADLDPLVDADPVHAAGSLDGAESFVIASYTQFSALYRRYGRAEPA
jgi:hypothetical protein